MSPEAGPLTRRPKIPTIRLALKFGFPRAGEGASSAAEWIPPTLGAESTLLGGVPL
jgi:hypothetical protein